MTPLTLINHAKGGIGNQLFQHVFCYSLAKKMQARVLTDIEFYQKDPYGFQAKIWDLAPQAQTTQISLHTGDGAYLIQEGQIRSLQDPLALPADAHTLVLSGYWQNEALLDRDIVNTTYQQLCHATQARASQSLVEQIKQASNSVALHIRRRDYGHMGLCKNSYYIAAIQHLRLNYPDLSLFVFSDEPNYAKHLLQSCQFDFTPVNSADDLLDLYLMSLCKHFVIANSSYSWWAAYFAEPKGGEIFCPKEWVTIDSTPSPCPARWVQIPYAIEPFNLNPNEISIFGQNVQKIRFSQAIQAWFAQKGDQTLRVNFPELKQNSIVFDLGGYQGDWTHDIWQRYQCQIYIFEPIQRFHQAICQRFQNYSQIKPFQCGLGAKNETQTLHLSADGTGVFGNTDSTENVTIKEASFFIKEQNIEHIHLMKINIEGGEYELLNHLIESGEIQKIDRLQIQFHDFVPDAIKLRAVLEQRLAQTHERSWCYYFVWEEWKRKINLISPLETQKKT